jgi:hypothetical protein
MDEDGSNPPQDVGDAAMDEENSNPPPSWLEPARRKDLATLTQIAERSRDLFILVETSDKAMFTIGPVNSEAFGRWVRLGATGRANGAMRASTICWQSSRTEWGA